MTVGAVVSIVGVILAIAGTLGVAYAVLRSASEQKLRELDKRIIDNYQALVTQLEAEKTSAVVERDAAERRAADYREALTQKAAVDHLAEMVEHQWKQQRETDSAHSQLLRDILEHLRRIQRGDS